LERERDGVQAVWESGVDVRVVFKVLPGGIVGDVEELIVEVAGVPDAMLVVAAVPYLPEDCSRTAKE
jgi:hypothetical protein